MTDLLRLDRLAVENTREEDGHSWWLINCDFPYDAEEVEEVGPRIGPPPSP